MTTPYQAIPVGDRIHWVGAIDWSIRDFHGYRTSRGTTYNAFLIRGEKTVLVDTVKAGFEDEMFARISSVCDPTEIDLVVSNHAEMDHSGVLPLVLERAKPSRLLASPMGVKALQAHFGDLGAEAVKDGDTLEVSGPGDPAGPLTLRFLETRFLHWPDSMFTYIPEQAFLFSQDGFGMHLAGAERFAEAVPEWLLEQEAAKYYANILMPFGTTVQKLLARLEELALPLRTVAPDHGPLWRERFPLVREGYQRWSTPVLRRKAVVVYDTMWGSTAAMARVVGEGLRASGAQVELMPLSGNHRSDIATELLDAGALVVGSPTLNKQLFPTVADVLSYLKGLKPAGRVGGAFGSYGWSGESVQQVDAALQAMGVEVLGQVKANYVPTEDTLAACHALGARVGEALAARFA